MSIAANMRAAHEVPADMHADVGHSHQHSIGECAIPLIDCWNPPPPPPRPPASRPCCSGAFSRVVLRCAGSCTAGCGHTGPLQQGLAAITGAAAPPSPGSSDLRRMHAELCQAKQQTIRLQDGALSLIASHVRGLLDPARLGVLLVATLLRCMLLHQRSGLAQLRDTCAA